MGAALCIAYEKGSRRLGKSLCVFFNRRYGNFLAKLNGVVNNTGKGINACGDTDNLNAEILNIDIDLVVPGAADDLAGGVVDLDISDISVVVGELYVSMPEVMETREAHRERSERCREYRSNGRRDPSSCSPSGRQSED